MGEKCVYEVAWQDNQAESIYSASVVTVVANDTYNQTASLEVLSDPELHQAVANC